MGPPNRRSKGVPSVRFEPLAPKLFGIEDKHNRQPHENIFVSPVSYGVNDGRILHLPAIESATRIVAETVKRKSSAMSNINRGMPFFDEMAKELLGRELILNCLIAKDLDWAIEQEVRQFILGENANLAPYVSMRRRGTESVPSVAYIKSHMPLHQPGAIAEIIIGPAAPSDAEEFVCSLLETFHRDPRDIISRSTKPYEPE